MGPDVIVQFSTNRLRGEPLPADLKVLLEHHDELLRRTGIELNWTANWAPWLDTSYLSDAERKNPDIAANLLAIEEVCRLSAFVAACEDGEYLGYWRGPADRSVAESPLVALDSEGQFRISAGRTFAEAVLALLGVPPKLRDWMRSLGIVVPWETENDIAWPDEAHDPGSLHKQSYYRHLGKSGDPTG